MADKKPQHEKFTTPRGIAKYPRLNEPDTKFDAEGVYTTKLVLPGELAQPVIDKLKAVAAVALKDAKTQLEAELAEAKGEKKGKLKKQRAELKQADMPFKPVFDDDGNETGSFEFNFKMKAKRTDKKTQKVIEMAPAFFDAQGVKLKTAPSVWGGTEMKVSCQLVPFYTAAVGAGVSLRLRAVQIIKLVSGGGGNAQDHGFGAEEDGEFAASDVAEKKAEGKGGDAAPDADEF